MLKSILLQMSGGSGSTMNFVMLGLMGVIFYIFFIRPQQKKQKDQKKFTEEVKKGDLIVTLGGIHGKILSIDDSTITLEIDRGSKMVVERSSISMESSKRLAEGK